MHRTGTRGAHDRAAMRVVRTRAKHVVLPAGGRIGREPGAHAARSTSSICGPRSTAAASSRDVLGVNRKRVQRLMRVMGIEAIYPKRRTTWPGAGHKIYPYLLRNVEVTRPDQVWASDITYVPLRHGFLYLVAVMDWYSRYVLSWRLSNTLTGSFCMEALDEALVAGQARDLQQRSRKPVHGHGVHVATGIAGVAISMDGRGRAIDNVFIERLWRSVKYEEVYLKDYADGWQAEASLAAYFRFYNEETNPSGARLPHAVGDLSRARLKRRAAAGRKTN